MLHSPAGINSHWADKHRLVYLNKPYYGTWPHLTPPPYRQLYVLVGVAPIILNQPRPVCKAEAHARTSAEHKV